MSVDEHFLIHLDMIDDKNVEQSLKNIDYRLKEISKDLLNVGYGGKEVAIFTNEMRTLSSVTKSVASAVAILNKTNAQAAKYTESVALAHQKVATEAGKTARELEKAKTETANTAVANQKLKTELEKTATAHAKAEMAALRVAQAHEKQAQKAQQAARPYNELNQQLREQAQKLQDAIVKNNVHGAALTNMINKYHELSDKVQTANQKFAELTKEQHKNINVTELLKKSFGTFIALLAHTGFTRAIQMFKDFAASVSSAGIVLDALQNTMLAATGGWESGGREIKWVIDMSNRLGLAFGDVSDSYAKFMTSFTRSGGTISQSRQIFEDLSTAMVSLHLPAERMQGVFVALEQMANKGTVQAEELKRQLGNALPGAFELAAESMGILPARLMDLMKKGEVFSKDFLPAFAATVKAALGQSIDIASMQFNASINRLATATDLLKMNLGQMVNEALLPLVNGLVTVTNALAKTAQFFNENTVASNLLKGALVGLLATVIRFNWAAIATGLATIGKTIVGTVIPAIGSLISKLFVLNAELGGMPLIIGAVVTAVAALGFNLADTAKKAGDITPYIGLGQQIVNLTKEVTALDTATDEGKQKLEEFKQSFPELTNYLTETGKKFSELSDEELKHIAVLGEHDAKMRVIQERTKELASWQSTFAAVCQVAWNKICILSKALWQTVLDAFAKIGEGVKWLFKMFGGKAVAEFQLKVGKGMQAVGKALNNPLMQAYGSALEGGANFVLNFEDNMESLKTAAQNAGKWIKDSWDNSGFAAEINAQKIANANQNALKKLEVINKNAKTTYDSLRQAQSAVSGLQSGGVDVKKGKSAKDKKEEADNEWQALQKRQAAITEQIRVNTLLHKSTTDLEEEYRKNQTEIDRVTKAIQELNKAEKELNMTEAEKAIKAWEDKKKALQDAEKLYKGMLLAGNSYNRTQLQQQRVTMKVLKAEVAYNEQLENQEDLMKITSRTAQQFTNTVFDSLFEPLRDGESLWTRFKDAGVNALKSIAQTWTKQFLQNIVTGFGAGFTTNKANGANFIQSLAGGFTGSITQLAKAPLQTNIFSTQPTQSAGSSGGVLSSVWSSVSGLFGKSTQKSKIPSGFGLNTSNNPQSILSSLAQQGNTLAQTLTGQVTPAVTGVLGGVTNLSGTATGAGTSLLNMGTSALGAGSSILGMANPAVMAAQSIASMATTAPIAAVGMGALGATMTIASTAFTTAAPALIKMAAAMATLATSSATAATSMAALAVATAANSAAQIPYVGWVLAPLAAAMTGAAIAAGTAMTGAAIGAGATMAGAGQMVGGAMAGIGNTLSGVRGASSSSGIGSTSAKVIPHAKGGIVSSPTMFPMQGGNIGLAGEAGTEVIAPARRMSNGDIGIGAVQPKVTVNNYTNSAVEVIKRPNNEMEIKISELNSMLSSSKTNKGWVNAQTRMSKQGKQIG